jgi:threonine aldolase
MNFRSDNESPAATEIMAAIARANEGFVHSYGADPITARLDELFGDLFETEVTVLPVISGTAANALSLSLICPPYGMVFCHQHAHVNNDECSAPEFFTGGAKLRPLQGPGAKFTANALREAIEMTGAHGDHEPLPAAVSVTQSTELGAVYRPEEIAAITEVARAAGMATHMDGARFGNAIATLGCAPADVTWRAGIDVLSFGATKNGALAAEAVVLFRPQAEAGRRRSRAGHLLSKMRFLSAQLEAYIADGLWLRLAAAANRQAARLADGLEGVPGATVQRPVEANEVFAILPPAVIDGLEGRGIHLHRWPGVANQVRLVCAYCTRDEDVDAVISAARDAAQT